MSLGRWILISVFILLAASLLAAVMTPSWRQKIQSHFVQPGREILATVDGDLLNSGQAVQIIKYRTADGIYVEILKPEADGSSKMVDRVLLPDKHDGLFNYQGHVTRLAVADIDEDGKLELLAPTFDNQLVPHLNVFRYNAQLGRLEPYPVLK